MINKVILVGNLGKDPDVNHTNSGKTYCKLSVATEETYYRGEEKKKDVEWHNVILWGKQAENAGQYLTKGSTVYIEGKVKTRTYEQDGTRKYITEIQGNYIRFINVKEQQQRQLEPKPATSNNDWGAGPADEDIPF